MDLSIIKVKDVDLQVDHFSLFIAKSKTDPDGEGQRAIVARNFSRLDPWSLLWWYLDEVKSGVGLQDSFLFSEMNTEDGQVIIHDFSEIKYKTVDSVIKTLAAKLELDIKNVGSHCLRIEGATEYTQRGVS